MSDDSELSQIEKDVILSALRCLHHLKYIGDIAVLLKTNGDILSQLVEEIVKLRESMHYNREDIREYNEMKDRINNDA